MSPLLCAEANAFAGVSQARLVAVPSFESEPVVET
jgi:hypothetical protein